MTLGTKLQNLRKERNMSQEALAELLNVSRQAVSKWETDISLPDTANIIAISKIFAVSTDYLLLDKEPAPTASKGLKSRRLIYLICGIASSAAGFLGNFTIYIFSRFIKVPVPNTLVIDGEERIYMAMERNFFRFVSQFDLWLLFWFFTLLFSLGIALLAYQYRTEIKSFILKLNVKFKSIIKKVTHKKMDL